MERRALRMAEIATGDRDEALDLVQEAMLGLARRYAKRSPADWPPLFYRILQNGIRDWHRRQRVRHRWRVWLGRGDEDDSQGDPLQTLPDGRAIGPDAQIGLADASDALVQALKGLPYRQQQVFLLRLWEGLDVRQTAAAMGCSEGSVKTHYSRAIHQLREQLKDHWS